jgi:RimJ/RimL family protein N-acetyltransferase
MRALTPLRLWRATRNRLWVRRELCIYVCPAERVRELPNPRRLRRDHFEDLRSCAGWSYEDMTRDEYLQHVDERRRTGAHHLYSLVEDGVLVHYGWITSRQERAPDAAIGLLFVPPPESAALWDYYTHPSARGRGLYTDSLRQCLHDAVEIDGARQVYIYVYADNAISRRAIEKAGFEYQGSLVMERRLWKIRRYATFAARPFDVRALDGREPAVALHCHA